MSTTFISALELIGAFLLAFAALCGIKKINDHSEVVGEFLGTLTVATVWGFTTLILYHMAKSYAHSDLHKGFVFPDTLTWLWGAVMGSFMWALSGFGHVRRPGDWPIADWVMAKNKWSWAAFVPVLKFILPMIMLFMVLAVFANSGTHVHLSSKLLIGFAYFLLLLPFIVLTNFLGIIQEQLARLSKTTLDGIAAVSIVVGTPLVAIRPILDLLHVTVR